MTDVSSMPATQLQQSGWRRLNWALYVLVLMGGLLTSFPIPILSGFARVQTDEEDTVHLHYLLEHGWRWVSDPSYPSTFWTPRYFHPAVNTFAYSENLIGTAPIYWALRVGLSEDISLQVWILITFAANYVAMLVVLRWFGVHPILATLGGYLFAFSLPRQAQLVHLLLLPQAFTPFAIYYFWKLLHDPDRRSWVLLLLMGAWQLLASIHLGWFLGFALATWFGLLAILDSACIKRLAVFLKRNPAFAAITFLIVALGLGLFFRNYYTGPTSVSVPYNISQRYSPPISNWLAAEPHTLWEQRLVLEKDQQNDMEDYLFCGFGMLAILLAAFLFGWEGRRSNQSRPVAQLSFSAAWCCLFLVAITFNFGGNLSMWYPIYSCVPGADGIRAIGRVVLLVIPIALIGGLPAIQYLAEEKITQSRRRNVLYAGLFALCALETVHYAHRSLDRAAIRARIDRYAAELVDVDAGFIFAGPEFNGAVSTHEATAMWAGMIAKMPVINGYSSRYPDNYPEGVGDDPLPAVLKFLGHSWRGRLLIVEMGSPPTKRYYAVHDGVATPVP